MRSQKDGSGRIVLIGVPRSIGQPRRILAKLSYGAIAGASVLMASCGSGAPQGPQTLTRWGEIEVSECACARDMGTEGTAFFRDTTAMPSTPCTRTTDGSCSIETCPNLYSDGLGVLAGDITVSSTNGAVVPLIPVRNEGYNAMINNTTLFAPGDTIHVAATGADVPPFSVDLTGPPAAAVGSPLGSFNGLTVDLSVPLQTTWIATPTPVEIELQQSVSDRTVDQVTVRCTFDGMSGQGTVPLSVLSHIRHNSGGSVDIGTVQSTTVMAGDYQISVYVHHWSAGWSTYFQ